MVEDGTLSHCPPCPSLTSNLALSPPFPTLRLTIPISEKAHTVGQSYNSSHVSNVLLKSSLHPCSCRCPSLQMLTTGDPFLEVTAPLSVFHSPNFNCSRQWKPNPLGGAVWSQEGQQPLGHFWVWHSELPSLYWCVSRI